MRIKSNRNILLWIASIFLFLSLIGAFFVQSIDRKMAQAEAAWQTGVFEMNDGVSLRLSKGNGMRFIVKMDESVADFVTTTDSAEMGFIIAPKTLMLEANGDYLNMPKKIGGAIDKNKIYQEGDYYQANACITNVKLDNFKLDFVAIAYIKYGEDVRYTDYNDLARHNMYDLVNMAFLNGYASKVAEYEYLKQSDEIGWYGSEQFPIVVEDTSEYNKLVNVSNDTEINLANNYVVVKNDANTTESFTDETPIILSAEIDELNKLIQNLPDSVTMPDAIGMVGRIRDVEEKYNALSDAKKEKVENYAKVETLLETINGYDRVYKNDATDGTVIPAYVPNYTASVGGTATTRTDDVYGNVLSVQSDASGRASLHFTNFPDVSKYEKVYFYVQTSVACDLYLSDGITNDGWGTNWKNTWSVSGYWCNANNWRLIEIDVSSGYIGNDFALGFRTTTMGISFAITDFYGYTNPGAQQEVSLNFGNKVDTGTTNENGKIYNIFREQWYIDNNINNTIGTLQANSLANALPSGYENFYFWMYNGTGTQYNFHLAGDVSGTWTDSADTFALTVGQWTKITISAADIQLNKSGQWYVYILGGDGKGAAKDGWQISPIYAGPFVEYVYTDHADLKDAISLINGLPETITIADKAAVEAARVAYDNLTETQKGLVNATKLTNAEAMLVAIEEAGEVVALIDAINARDIDEALVENAREAYDNLPVAAQNYVTNITVLEGYEAQLRAEKELQVAVEYINTTIASLPETVTMPDDFIYFAKINMAKDAYNALSDEGKSMVQNYAKLRTLIAESKDYKALYTPDASGITAVPAVLHNSYPAVGVTGEILVDTDQGTTFKATAGTNGKAAIQFANFPFVEKYMEIYFYVRSSISGYLYMADDGGNDGWGTNWANNSGTIANYPITANTWTLITLDVSTGIISDDWIMSVWNSEVINQTLEVGAIYVYSPDYGTETTLAFGKFTDSGTVNEYGKIYNFTQGWSSETDMGAFNQNALSGYLAEGDDSFHFWIYNPQESAVDMNITGDMNSWNPQGEYVTNLAAKAWTEVILTPEIVQLGNNGTWYVNVTAGANASGWKISAMYSFNSNEVSQDAVGDVQTLINALNTQTVDEESVTNARSKYEKLSEAEKEFVTVDNLIACEKSLYGDMTADVPFIVDGESKYKIYYEAGLKEAATFFAEQLEKATGVRLPVVAAASNNITKYRYAIMFGYTDLAANVTGSAFDESAITSRAGYSIRRSARTVCLEAISGDGYRMAVLAFLREVVGYEMISEDCVVYNGDASVLPAFNLIENPSFDYRQQQTYMTDDEVLGMGLQAHTDLWIPSSEGWDMHNVLHYVPVATYGTSHSNWYISDKTQICPTAGGTAAEFNAMVEVIVANMMVRINAYPDRENISFSMMDSAGNDACTCTRCKLYNTLYGEAGFSAAWIDLMNAINERIQAQIGDRKLNIAFLAYRTTEKAPASINANGEVTLMKRYQINDDGSYTQTSEDLKCDDGVMVWLAPIDGKYAENFNHADNAATLALIKKWCALSDNVYLWMYGTNFKFYMYPYNTWQASAENYKILAELGVKGAWSQSNETEATAFSDLKAYIDSKFMFNVNADYETVLDTYFTNYFGAGAEKMRSMFDAIVAKCEEIEVNYDGLGRGIYDEIENVNGFLGIGLKTYWSKDWLNSLVTLCDEAKALVDADTSLTEEQKTAIKNRITKESLFPRYVLCTSFASSYSNSNKKAMRQAFKADATMLGLTLYKEANGLLSGLYDDWGV